MGQSSGGWSAIDSYRVVFWVYAGLGVAILVLSLALSGQCEQQRALEGGEGQESVDGDTDGHAASAPLLGNQRNGSIAPEAECTKSTSISKGSRTNLVKIIFLFALNSLGSGMVPMWVLSTRISKTHVYKSSAD